MAKKKVVAETEPVETLAEVIVKLANRLQPVRYTMMEDREYALLMPEAVKDARKALYQLAESLTNSTEQ